MLILNEVHLHFVLITLLLLSQTSLSAITFTVVFACIPLLSHPLWFQSHVSCTEALCDTLRCPDCFFHAFPNPRDSLHIMDVTWCVQQFLDVSSRQSDLLVYFSPRLSRLSSFPFSYSSCPQYRYQDDESPPPEHSFPRLTNEVRAPELVHVSEKNLSEIENVHGYVSHSHISPLKVSYFSNSHAMRARSTLTTLW